MLSNSELKISKIEEGLFIDLFAREFELIHLREMMSGLFKSQEMELSSDPDAGLKLLKLLCLSTGTSDSIERIEDFYIEATYRAKKVFANPAGTLKAAKVMIDLIAHFDWNKHLSEAFEIFECELFQRDQVVIRNLFSQEGVLA